MVWPEVILAHPMGMVMHVQHGYLDIWDLMKWNDQRVLRKCKWPIAWRHEDLVATNSISLSQIPWFRVHMVILNDPGHLLAVHLIHTSLYLGWSSIMLLYELLLMDTSDPTYNPIWRQGTYVMPFISHTNTTHPHHRWSLSISQHQHLYWSYEHTPSYHIILSGLIILAACWHWGYSDLDAFSST